MYKSRIRKITVVCLLLLTIAILNACGSAPVQEQEAAAEEQGGFVKIAPGAYDSADTAIVVSKQEKKNTITFFNLKKKKTYTLAYDGITQFMDKYGSQISVSQLKEGEMADVQFLKDEKLLTSLTVSPNVWSYENVSRYELDMAHGTLKMLDETYTFDEDMVIISEGKQVELLELNAQDVLGIKGIDHTIYSIIIEQGHGYLRLEKEDYFIGGWIEIGQKIIRKIEEDMLLTVPEGKYTVFLSHSGIEGTKEVSIKRGEETKLDVGDLKKEDLIKYGNLIFTVEPADALVYIDSKPVDISRSIKAEYGLHQIMAKKEGYETVIQYIRVTGDGANVSITLDKEKEHSLSENTVAAITPTPLPENSLSGNSTEASGNAAENSAGNSTENQSGNNDSEVTETTDTGSTTGYKVTLEAPAGAEAYVDGSYVGIIPISFPKEKGSHTVTIRKTDYMTRSYTIDVDDEEKDISFSFSDLTPIE